MSNDDDDKSYGATRISSTDSNSSMVFGSLSGRHGITWYVTVADLPLLLGEMSIIDIAFEGPMACPIDSKIDAFMISSNLGMLSISEIDFKLMIHLCWLLMVNLFVLIAPI